MGNKILKKSKGKWIVVSASVLATMTLSTHVQAEEAVNHDEVVVEAVSEETVVEAVGDTVVNEAEVVEDNHDTTVEAVSTVEESEAVQESEPANDTEPTVDSETTETNSEQVESTEVSVGVTGDDTLPAETEEVVTEETTTESVKAEDVQVEKTEESVVRKFNTPTVSPVSPTVKTYQTVSGDTLWKIANQYKVSVANLMDWNKLTSNLIRVNQKLVVSNPTTQTTQPVDKPTTPTKPVEEKPAETTKPVETKPVTKTTNYTIKRGDTLNRIAAQHGVSVAQLRQWNNISGHLIYPNQKIIVNKVTTTQPVEPTKPEEKPTTPTKPVETKPVTKTTNYTIKRGDTLNRIAAQHGVSVAQLRQWNNISGHLIYPNQKIIVNKVTTTQPVETTKPEEKPTTPTKPVEEKPVETKPETKTTHYTIKRGDTLNRIAQQYGVSVAQLRQWNNISGSLIHPNQKIIVNKVTTTKPEEKPTEPTKPETKPEEKPTEPTKPVENDKKDELVTIPAFEQKKHTVSYGDTLYEIARANNVTVNQIMTWNKLSSTMIRTGQNLNVSDPSKTTGSITLTRAELEAKIAAENEKLRIAAEAQKKAGDRVVEVDADYDGTLIKTYWNQTGYRMPLTTVASRYGVTVAQLKQWNPLLTSNYLLADQEIAVSDPEAGNPAKLGRATKNYLVINEASEKVTSEGVQKVLDWFKARENKTFYSMTDRNGPNSYDCSSAVYYALINAGYLNRNTWIGNTDSMFAMEGGLLLPIPESQVRAGDIFISGYKYNSSGAAGHTGVAINNKEIYHSTYNNKYFYDGIVRTQTADRTGSSSRPLYWYRLNENYRRK
ncbi:LysM peptidoglycan-binding domain-containing protein [Globicatella sanguinis]|nr:LysM peptidoglycan-binding domain-containing protein [Globicatella sanguinis]WIK67385.1 LysM peptidoglycan-binding domain-containing protein [Globicatella sanguinis]WKT56790.1 LysM peptidoglycan-binding domain-containing protein [Globicatella sanguinis]